MSPSQMSESSASITSTSFATTISGTEETLDTLQEGKAGVTDALPNLFLSASDIQSSNAISISPVFTANGPESITRPPVDTILVSSDNIVFYVDEPTLLNVSANSFNGHLPLRTQEKLKRTLFLSDIISSELQVFLKSIYDLSSDPIPELDMLMRGIDLLPKYGIQPRSLVTPGKPVFEYILSYAPTNPLEIYAFAASHDVYALAIQVSSHLLGIDLTTGVNMEMCEKMGAKYLLKLFKLHLKRKEVLKRLLTTVPDLHTPAGYCGYEEQKRLKTQWTFGMGQLAWVLHADISAAQIQKTILDTTRSITCQECLKTRDAHLAAILQDWSMASRTI